MISKKHEKVFSICTIKRFLNSVNLFAYTPSKKPRLTTKHIKIRKEISRSIIKMEEDKAKSIIFSDESKFNLRYSDGKSFVWRYPHERLETKNLESTVKFGGGSVMVWACFSFYGTGRLEIIENTMNSTYYVDLLSRNLQASAIKMGLNEFIFQQDNDPKHTSKLAKEYFEENRIKVLPWPAQSPDLNPIEHLWDHIKRKVAEKCPKNISQLKEFIKEEWCNIDLETCQKYALSFKKRALEIFNANGGHVKY